MAEEGSNCLSRLTFHWANPLLTKGSLGLLQSVDDLYDLPLELKTEYISQLVSKVMLINQPLPSNSDGENETTATKFSLIKALHKCFGRKFYSCGILKLFADILGFAGPLFLHEIVNFIGNKDVKSWMGYVYATGLCTAGLLSK